MAGIVSYGAYIPAYRLSRDEIARQTGRPSLGGARAVANFDEDSLTMAVSAGTDCLTGFERGKIDGLYFATTTAPYREKQSANVIAGALDLKRQVRTADFGRSLRSGASALKAAVDAVDNNSGNFLVLAADCRLGTPQSDQEQLFGDAAAALL